METIEIRYERFECQKVRQRVIVNSLVLPAGKDEAMNTSVGRSFAFDCDQKQHCGVLTDFGQGSSIDWSGCVCPDLNPK
jgi:hypothetical protein